MKVSIVTPNYNGFEFLDVYFKSLKAHMNLIEEIVIVDNASSDGSVEYISQIMDNYPIKIHLIQNNSNKGFAEGVNQGIRSSKSEFVFLLNNDVELEKTAIENLIKCINQNDLIFSVSSKMVQYNNRNLIDDAGDSYTLVTYTKKIGNNQDINKYNTSYEIFSSCAGAALYRKSLIEEIGYFDSEFFAYMEDVDIGYRAQIYGYKNYYCPDAIIYHIGSGSSGSQYNDFKIPLAARNNVWLIYKNFPIPQKIVNFPFIFLGFLIKYLFFLKKGFGSIYLDGIKEGLNTRSKIKKTKYTSKHFKNYFKIEWKLIKNTFGLFKK
ncbi:glycosyltransferase family 2 protein [uncultured Methanobrevibacter sp.]|uniref:glycosyltransferase family 2 protein n=1 Tax=uncultured Methanobrevibacter sp. TaxID=253161 RepID=UPI0025FF41CC|nr:glycosyltransferase family 2 protein [uncultured Methanobrevibacter sp.]